MYPHATERTALVRGEGKAENVNGLLCSPQQRTPTGSQRTEPMAPRVAKTARPVVIQSVEGSHLPVEVDLETRFLDSSTGAAIHPGEASASRDLPALVVRVVIRTKVHVNGQRDVPHAANTIFVFPGHRGWRVHFDAGNDLRRSDPGAHFFDGSEQPQGRREFVPAVVEEELTSTVAGLLESPLVRIAGDVPAAASARHHLHVIATDRPKITRIDGLFQLDQRLVEEVVLHHPELKTPSMSFFGHRRGTLEVVGEGFL